MAMGYELEDRDILRDTPEGELWTSVLVDALEDLQGSAKWLDEVYEARRERLEGAREAGEGSPARHRERMRDLERERAERKAQIVSCTRFFFDEDSPLDFICDVLGYPVELIRKHARLRFAAYRGGRDEPEAEIHSAH